MDMTLTQKKELVTRHTEEIITAKDLEALLAAERPIKHYIGFEISGEIHLGTGIASMQKVKDITDAGISPTIFLADWHTWINDKLGGDREAIRRIAAGYFKEGLSVCYHLLGGDSSKLSFIFGSDFYHENDAYWEIVIAVAKHITLNRVKRSVSILGREEKEEIDFAKLIYPIMQVADIFALGVDIAHAGMDQRKAHVIARDVAEKIGKKPPVAIHHHLLLGLQKELLKMSKSKPESAVFIADEPETIREKVMKAYCPPEEILFNPIVDWTEHLIFPREERGIVIKRDASHGGDLALQNAEELKSIFQAGDLHPEDLKHFVAEYLINLLAPARGHFSSGAPKEMFEDLKRLQQKIAYRINV